MTELKIRPGAVLVIGRGNYFAAAIDATGTRLLPGSPIRGAWLNDAPGPLSSIRWTTIAYGDMYHNTTNAPHDFDCGKYMHVINGVFKIFHDCPEAGHVGVALGAFCQHCRVHPGGVAAPHAWKATIKQAQEYLRAQLAELRESN